MSLGLLFRIFAVISTLNALGLIFATSTFLGMAGLTESPSLITLGQGLGVAILSLAIIHWRIPDIASAVMPAFGQLAAIIVSLNWLLILYHTVTGQVSGVPAYANLILFLVLAVLFFMYSRKSA